MEDINEEMILDIDSNDANNSLAVVEYIEDLYSYYRQVEVPFSQNFSKFQIQTLQMLVFSIEL